jgi:hypothetical protein
MGIIDDAFGWIPEVEDKTGNRVFSVELYTVRSGWFLWKKETIVVLYRMDSLESPAVLCWDGLFQVFPQSEEALHMFRRLPVKAVTGPSLVELFTGPYDHGAASRVFDYRRLS